MEQPKYLERAKDTYNYHRDKILNDDRWCLSKTAKSLKRSIGSVSEDLIIARFAKTHDAQLRKIKYACDALEFIREKQKEEELEKID